MTGAGRAPPAETAASGGAPVVPLASFRSTPVVDGRRRFVQVTRLVGGLAAAALALFVARGALGPKKPESPNHLKGEADLGFYMLRGGEIFPGDEAKAVREGDQLQFTYRGPYSSLVIVGVDGDGGVMTYYPDLGDAPVAITPGDRQVLDGAILLDDAPGPEVFIAFFGDGSVEAAEEEVRRAWRDGGVDGVRRLDEDRPDVSALVLSKE
jgi:hypothetical protein